MERGHRAGVTTFVCDRIAVGDVELGEQAAHHAQVRRLSVGADVSVTDGRGQRGDGRIVTTDKRSLVVQVDRVTSIARPPEIHLFVPVADRDRMLWLAEKATELQVTSWNPVMYRRSTSVSPRGEGDAFDKKLLARMSAAIEQSGGAWLPEVREVREPAEVARTERTGYFLERGGAPLGFQAPVQAPMSLAVGPEGGFDVYEVAAFDEAGWKPASIGKITLRFETAAVAAVAVARAALDS